jgi:hypothetical protein
MMGIFVFDDLLKIIEELSEDARDSDRSRTGEASYLYNFWAPIIAENSGAIELPTKKSS